MCLFFFISAQNKPSGERPCEHKLLEMKPPLDSTHTTKIVAALLPPVPLDQRE